MAKANKFDPTKQYGDYCLVTSGDDDSLRIAKDTQTTGMQYCIPEKYRHLVKWITMHNPASSIKVKDDNYEMLGASKDEIGDRIDIPESWSVAWKYTPSQFGKLKKIRAICDKYRNGVQSNVSMSNSLQEIIAIFSQTLTERK